MLFNNNNNQKLSFLILCACVSMCVSFITTRTTDPPTLQIVWMVPFKSHTGASYMYNASSSVATLALGLDTVSKLPILKKYQFKVEPDRRRPVLPGPALSAIVSVIDTMCNRSQALGALVDLIDQVEIDVIIGPPCADVVTTIAELMAYRNTPIISWISLGQTIADKKTLKTFTRTMAPMTSLGDKMVNFYIVTNTTWKRFVIVSNKGDAFVAGAQIIKDALAVHEGNGFQVVHHYSGVSPNAPKKNIDEIFKTIKYEGRVIILVIPRNELRKYMLRAHALGMTKGDYQFLFTETKLASSDDKSIINSDALWKKNDSNDDAARQAFENVLIFVIGRNRQPSLQWGPSANISYKAHFGKRTDVPLPTEPDQYASYLHDAIVLYGYSLNQSLANNDTGRGSDVYHWTSKQHFRGLSGNVVMDSKGDRQPEFFVYDLNKDGIFQQVSSMIYIIDPITNNVTLNSTFSGITWGDGTTTPHIPSDTPACGFFGELCPTAEPHNEEKYLLISLSTSVPSLVILLAMYIYYRWWRWEKDLKNTSWKINAADLDYSFSKRAFSASVLQLVQSAARKVSLSSQASLNGSLRRPRTSTAHIDNAPAPGAQIFTQIARYDGEIVAVKRSIKKKITIDRAFLLEMKHMVAMKHGNLTNFIGVCTAPEKICAVWEYCNKGSLQDVIGNDDIRLDSMFKMSLAVDICQGLQYIHKSPLKFHGNLRSSNCVIDNRWVCKLTDFGLQSLRVPQDVSDIGEHAYYANLFWTSPENLRKILDKDNYEGSHKADVYALGIIAKELLCRNDPYSTHPNLTPKEIIHKVAYPKCDENIFRPVISVSDLGEDFRRRNMEFLIHRCWAEDPDYRPVVKAVLRIMNKLNPYKKDSVVDNMIAMMEKYTDNLEDIVAKRTQQLEEEKKKTDALLYKMLPEKVAEDLKVGREVQAEAFDSVTIYFSDIVHFTALASESTPLQIVEFLNALYILFDDIISYYDVYKVETIGDAYMVVSGLPVRNGQQHAREIASMALDILNNIFTFKIPHNHEKQLQIRIGVHTGSAVAGVVGMTMPRYCLFGDTVNTASRMESTGKPLMIHVSSVTRDALQQYSNFITEERGEVQIKGKGLMKTYWLTGIYCSGEEMSKKPFHEPFKPNLEDRGHCDKLNSLGTDNTYNTLCGIQDGNDGNLNVTDPGIASDSRPDNKDANVSRKESKSEKHEYLTIMENFNNHAMGTPKKTRHFSVDGDIGEKEERHNYGRKSWPELPTFEDIERELMNNESDEDSLFEAAVNHFIDQERKNSHPVTYADIAETHSKIETITGQRTSEEFRPEKSKSHSKYKITKSDSKRKKKRKSRSSVRSEPPFDTVAHSTEGLHLPEHLGPNETSYFSDEFQESNDDDDVNLSNHSSPSIKLRGEMSTNSSPCYKNRLEKPNGILGQRLFEFNDDKIVF